MEKPVFWIDEDLPQRKPPHAMEHFEHGYVVLPFRRNNLDDGYVFAMRLSLRKRSKRDPETRRQRIYPFEDWVRWQNAGPEPQLSILMTHALFPVSREVLIEPRGFLLEQEATDRAAIDRCFRFIAGLIWDERIAEEILPRPSSHENTPRFVRGLRPGMVVVVDGTPGVVVSNKIVHTRHHFALLALVPLMANPPPSDSYRVQIDGLAAVPEFLKICQTLEGPPMQAQKDSRSIPEQGEDFALLLSQVQSLLAREESRGLPPSLPRFRPAEHRCLFLGNPRPWGDEPRESEIVPERAEASGASGEPIRITAKRFDGPEGDLRIEVWRHGDKISVDLVMIHGRLHVIDQLSILSADRRTVDIIHGPIFTPQDHRISETIGEFRKARNQSIEVYVIAPGIDARYSFRLHSR